MEEQEKEKTCLGDDRLCWRVNMIFRGCAIISRVDGLLIIAGYLYPFGELQQAIPCLCAAAHHASVASEFLHERSALRIQVRRLIN
jgi:hypothetical protein